MQNNQNDYDHTCGVPDEKLSQLFKEAVRLENEKKKIKGMPVAKYDKEKQMPYLEYPNGDRVYGEQRKSWKLSPRRNGIQGPDSAYRRNVGPLLHCSFSAKSHANAAAMPL